MIFVCEVNAHAIFHCLLIEKYVLCPWLYFLLWLIIQFLHNLEDLTEGTNQYHANDCEMKSSSLCYVDTTSPSKAVSSHRNRTELCGEKPSAIH